MKKYLNILLALTVLVLAGCQSVIDEQPVEPDRSGSALRVNVGVEGTRAGVVGVTNLGLSIGDATTNAEYQNLHYTYSNAGWRSTNAPDYWPTTNEIAVRAWFPYSAWDSTNQRFNCNVLTDQSVPDNVVDSEFLYWSGNVVPTIPPATSDGKLHLDADGELNLVLSRMMSKLNVTLNTTNLINTQVSGPVVTYSEYQWYATSRNQYSTTTTNVTEPSQIVVLLGGTAVNATYSPVTQQFAVGSDVSDITMFGNNNQYECIIVPQTANATLLMTVKFTVTRTVTVVTQPQKRDYDWGWSDWYNNGSSSTNVTTTDQTPSPAQQEEYEHEMNSRTFVSGKEYSITIGF